MYSLFKLDLNSKGVYNNNNCDKNYQTNIQISSNDNNINNNNKNEELLSVIPFPYISINPKITARDLDKECLLDTSLSMYLSMYASISSYNFMPFRYLSIYLSIYLIIYQFI
jgi:hypothetical protein